MNEFTLNQLIRLKNPELLDKDCRVKLVRHKGSRIDFTRLIEDRNELFDYQAEQAKPVFHDVDYIISFIGVEGTHSLLLGVFKINGFKMVEGKYAYDICEVDKISSFKDRLVIDWGKGAINWHQWLENDKPIVELLPQAYLPPFKSLESICISFSMLRSILNIKSKSNDWFVHLSSNKGIYLILDRLSGNHYIGKADGGEGIWGRWESYGSNGHGGNKALIELIKGDPDYMLNFQYSILQQFPKGVAEKEINTAESIWKKKLGSRVFGLNNN